MSKHAHLSINIIIIYYLTVIRVNNKNELHQNFTRSASLHLLPKPRTNKFKMSLAYRGPTIWNSLNKEIKNSASLLLKFKLKSFI